MGPLSVVEADTFSNDTRILLWWVVAMAMGAVLFRRSDNAFVHPVLLRAVCGSMTPSRRP